MVYVVFEGIDGAGKTTQARLLANKLNAFLFHEPYPNELGNYIKKMIKAPSVKYEPETMALMFAAQRMVLKDELLKDKIKNEKWVIGDRSFYSSIVYQHALGCDLEWLKELNKYMIVPDITIVLDISIETFIKRRGETDIIFEKKEFQKKIRDLYLKLPSLYPDHNIK
ncbi:MAG: dTMP kinase, partial [Candidatus Nanohaloarchaeota archaeon]|nr:dTMP kinase [Candidatus Nanohaloarchaeota archaeon]